MVHLRPASKDELEIFDAMDRQDHARDFVVQTGLATHQRNFDDPHITYLNIEDGSGECCGYFILALEPDTDSVEFRRILIDQNRRGIGQLAIAEMESYCRTTFGVKRIWVDVFEDNEIGMHIYEKMGYQRFDETHLDGRRLYLYDKRL